MSKSIDLNGDFGLETLGLADKEARVYLALLKGGEMSAIALSTGLELHRQFVYNALRSLQTKGLVVQLGKTRSKWRAQNPRKLVALAEEQELRAEKISDQLLALMRQPSGQEFDVTEGIRAFRSRILATIRKIPPTSTVSMICGEWMRYFALAGDDVHAEWDRIRIAKGISFRVIGPAAMETSFTTAAARRALMEYRVLEGMKENLVNTVIYEDRVDFDMYGEPHVTFSIKNPAIAQSQQKFFETLWKLGKKSD